MKGSPGDLKIIGFNIAIDGQKPSFFPKRNFPQLKILTTIYDFLLMLNILIFAIRKKGEWKNSTYSLFLVITGITGGLAFLTKTTGISVLMTGIIILLLEKENRRRILFFALPACAVSSIYFIWGFILTPDIFPKILVEQSTERIFVGSLSFIQQLFKYGMSSFPIDGW